MTDSRKPVHRPDTATQDVIRDIAHAHLLECTSLGAAAIGCSGASFSIIALGILAAEMAELDPRAAAQMLTALGDLYDPATSVTKKAHAEKRRQHAVTRIHAAVDIAMAQSAGTA